MENLRELLDDVMEFADKYDFDPLNLLYDLASAVPVKRVKAESLPAPVVPVAVPDSKALAVAHDRLMESMEHCHIAQQFWLAQPKGFQASAPEIYRLAGVPWRERTKRFSLWLTGRPEARARFAGRRDQPGRHRVWERI